MPFQRDVLANVREGAYEMDLRARYFTVLEFNDQIVVPRRNVQEAVTPFVRNFLAIDQDATPCVEQQIQQRVAALAIAFGIAGHVNITKQGESTSSRRRNSALG